MDERRLREIEQRANAATPGPWHPRHTDDEAFMNAYYVGLDPAPEGRPYPMHDTRCGLSAGDEDQEPSNRVVAITLLQAPRLVDVGDGETLDGCLWEENADFIAHSRADVPDLVAEVRRLQAEVERLTLDLRATRAGLDEQRLADLRAACARDGFDLAEAIAIEEDARLYDAMDAEERAQETST